MPKQNQSKKTTKPAKTGILKFSAKIIYETDRVRCVHDVVDLDAAIELLIRYRDLRDERKAKSEQNHEMNPL